MSLKDGSEEAFDRLCHEACVRNLPLLARNGEIIELAWVKPPRPRASFGLIDDWVTVRNPVKGAPSVLLIPFHSERLGWVKQKTLRLFRLGPEQKSLEKIDSAELHRKHPVVFARLDRGGTYGLIGLHSHPLVQQTIRLLCELTPIARTLPERSQMALRDRVCEVILCARDMNQLWESREVPQLARPAMAGETLCDRCRNVEILDLPECKILKDPADRPGDDGPLDEGDYDAGFRLIADIPLSPELQEISFDVGGGKISAPAANAAIVFYPATADGENAPVADGPFRLVIFGHAKRAPGELEPVDTTQDFRQVSGILAQFARWGFVGIAPDLSWLFNQIDGKRIALEDAGKHMLDENSRSGSPFEGKIITFGMGALGHSSGGLAALSAGANAVLPIDAIGLIAPAAPPSVLTPAVSDLASFAPKPVLVIHGTRDTSVDDQPLILFAAAAPKKHLVIIEGANHFGYTDEIHGAPDPEDISQSDQQRIAKAFLTAFYRRYLRGAVGMSDYLSGVRRIEGLEAFDIIVEADL